MHVGDFSRLASSYRSQFFFFSSESPATKNGRSRIVVSMHCACWRLQSFGKFVGHYGLSASRYPQKVAEFSCYDMSKVLLDRCGQSFKSIEAV